MSQESLLFVRTQTNAKRTYLLVVENQRVSSQVQQRVLHRLGRLDKLLASGGLDALLQSLGRFSEKWKQDYAIEGAGQLALHQLYRALAWLGAELPAAQQPGATPLWPALPRI